jgi:nitrite reductase/ring-hydroxylating ferredoxin subunit
MSQLVPLCHADDLPDRSARGFDPGMTGRDTLFVVRLGDTLHGWHDRCPHEGATPLPYRRHAYLNKAATRIVCFAHGAQFDIGSGQCLVGPCIGQALAKVPLTISADGLLMAEVP